MTHSELPSGQDLAAAVSPQIGERAAAGAILLLPIGSTEQHGPHLPLGTDTDVAITIARRATGRLSQAVLAPAIAYGSSGEHAGFPGTISIGQQALELMLVELGRSAGSTFARLVFVSAHGGNAGPVGRAVRRLTEESRAVLLWQPHWSGDAHAGRTETSLQLAIDPSRVRLEDAVAGNTEPLRDLIPRMREQGVAGVSPTGVLGDPAGASAAEGASLLDSLTDDLVNRIIDWTRTAAGPDDGKNTND